MNSNVEWPKGLRVNWMGRNGLFESRAVEVYDMADRVRICPVTTREKVGNCFIEIPRESLIDLMVALTRTFNPSRQISPKENTVEVPEVPAAYSEQVALPSVARGQGESRKIECTYDNNGPAPFPPKAGIIRLDEDFMKDIQKV